MAEISIHAIDVARAVPASGMRVVVSRLDDAADIVTDARLDEKGTLAITIATPASRLYEVTFYIADFLRRSGIELPDPPFLGAVPFRFGIADDSALYHLPLKFTPWGFSLFRGG